MKKAIRNLILLLLLALFVFVYYYITLPAVNIHATGFWNFLIGGLIILLIMGWLRTLRFSMNHGQVTMEQKPPAHNDRHRSKLLKAGCWLTGGIVLIYIIGTLLSSPIINAKKYQQLLTVENGTFTEDIKAVNFNQIPLLDKSTATLLGNRKMGSMVDMVSQFEVSDLYTQINYNGKPVRVTPLQYASTIKWLTNQSNGIPAYILIDMATQDTECIKLEEGIKYSQSELFNRNIYRHLRFKHPTYIFDQLNFEIDDNGIPYWIAPVKKYNIGLFGGQTIGHVVLCNAITGETTDYAVEDVPNWVDRVYSAELLTGLYNYYGSLKHGFLNSVLSQKDCLQTTNGYNYLAVNDDVWVYTGITSVSGDQSNVGFVLMNQRTMKTKFYAIEGATEESAMASAEGQVQNLGYRASFPLLLNISNEPTYFIALKDGAGLVKKYAMVNIQKYQYVAIGDTVADCEKSYVNLLDTNGISSTESGPLTTLTSALTQIVPCVVNGNTHYYIKLEASPAIFDLIVSDHIGIINYNLGDSITLEYMSTTDTPTTTTVFEVTQIVE